MTARIFVGLGAALLLAPAALAGQWWDGLAPHGFAGRVADIRVVGSDIMVCGTITANGTTATPTIAVWSGSAWQALAPHPPFEDLSHLAIIDGMVVTNGVNPSWIPDGPYRWTGSQWEVMGGGLETGYINRIECSAEYGGQPVVGGFFGGGVAFWDGGDWVVSASPQVSGVALDLVVYAGDLYAAGDIVLDGIPGSTGLVKWNGLQWEAVTALDPVTMTPQGGFSLVGSYAYTTSLAVHEGKLIVAGVFNQIGSMPTSNVVSLDAATGQWGQITALGAAPNDLEVFAGELYAGGPEGTVPGAAGPGSLGRLVGGDWLEAGTSPRGTVDALAADTVLLVGGLFDSAGGAVCGNFVTWNGIAYGDLANTRGLGLNGNVQDFAAYGGMLLAGGQFTLAGSEPITGLAQWNDPGWSSFAGSGPDGEVFDLHVDGTDFYVAGDFTSVNGQDISQIARYDGAIWSGIPAPLPVTPTSVTTLGGDLYAGTTYYYRDDQNVLRRGYLARWDGGAWTLIMPDAVVYDLEVFGGELWAAVDYVEIQGDPHSVVSYDGATLAGPLPSVTNVLGLDVVGGTLFMFDDYGSMQTWDGSQLAWSGPTQLDLPQGSSGFGLGRVHTLHDAGDRIYIGSRGDYNGYTAWEWDPVSGVAAPLDLGTNSDVWAISPFGTAVFFGGRFTLAGIPKALNYNAVGNPVPAGGVARWDPGVSAVNPLPATPVGYDVGNHPNPFNPGTTIRFSLPAATADLRIAIHDARGRLVREFDLGRRDAGVGTVVWDGRDGSGQAAASGVYFCRLDADGTVVARPMTLLK